MSMEPGYGETPLEPDEVDALTPAAREAFGDEPNKIDLYAAEQAIHDEVSVTLMTDIVRERLSLNEILSSAFLRDLHHLLYADLWLWAGRYRQREKNIGIDPAQISVELRNSLDNLHYRWAQTDDWSAREFGIAVHAETVRIHPFVDGNGRTTRLLADLVYLASQHPESDIYTYDWNVPKNHYISLLRDYDHTRDPRPLAAFVPAQPLEG